MTHPDDETLQRWFDGDTAAEADALRVHVEACDRCAAKVAGLRALQGAFGRWADAVASTQDDLADRIFAAPDANGSVKPGAEPTPYAPPVATAIATTTEAKPAGRVIPFRRQALWPLVAVAAAAGIAFVLKRTPAPRTPPQHDPVVAHHDPVTTPPDPTNPGSLPEAWEEATRVAEVTRLEVHGAQSYTVLDIPGTHPGTTSAVVWIADTPDDEDPSSPENH